MNVSFSDIMVKDEHIVLGRFINIEMLHIVLEITIKL
jgi:hypothetical protein